MTAATKTSEGWGAYITGSERVTFLEQLGFVQNPEIAKLSPNATGFSVSVSNEQLALTRLVLADPDIAILDEATAEAGSAGARVLEATAERALRDRTAIVIAHRLTQAVDADRVVVMEKGRVVEVGRHADLVRTDGPYARLWSAWTSAR